MLFQADAFGLYHRCRRGLGAGAFVTVRKLYRIIVGVVMLMNVRDLSRADLRKIVTKTSRRRRHQ